jgi:hypothetical protein
MRKAAAKVRISEQKTKEIAKKIATKANSSFFILHSSLFFVPLQAIRVSNSYFLHNNYD